MILIGTIPHPKMEECQICDSMLFLIKEYAYQLQQLDKRISYYQEEWLHVTLYNCNPVTCHDRYKILRDAEHEKYLITNRYAEINKEFTVHYRENHLNSP